MEELYKRMIRNEEIDEKFKTFILENNITQEELISLIQVWNNAITKMSK